MLYLLLRKGQMGFNGNNAEEGLAKSHIRQYVRMDGTVVQEHQDRRVAKHPDILAHEDTHGDRVYAGSKLEHGPELATQLEASGWKRREVSAVRKKEGAALGTKEDMPGPSKIKGANQENRALLSAQRILYRMHEAVKNGSDPVASLHAISTSRANPYLAALDTERRKLLEHFGHEVDGGEKQQKFDKDGHTVILSSDGKEVAFAGADIDAGSKSPAPPDGLKKLQIEGREKLEHGQKIMYRAPEMPRRRMGTITGSSEAGWHVTGQRQSHALTPSQHVLPREQIWTIPEHKADRAPKGTHIATSLHGRILRPEIVNERAKIGYARLGMTEWEVLSNPEVLRTMQRKLNKLASTNGMERFTVRDGTLHSNSMESTELFSDFEEKAIGSLRRQTAHAPEEMVDEFRDHLQGRRDNSRIFFTMMQDGRTGALRKINRLAAEGRLHTEYDTAAEDSFEAGMRDVAASVAVPHAADSNLSRWAASKAAIGKVFSQMRPQDADLLRRRFGAGEYQEAQSVATMARKLGTTKEKVDQALKLALQAFAATEGSAALREFLKSLREVIDLRKARLAAPAGSNRRSISGIWLIKSNKNHGDHGRFAANPSQPSEEFLTNSKGQTEFGHITPEISQEIRRQAAPIRLRAGDEKEGLAHIERESRLRQLQAVGYRDGKEAIEDVAEHFDAIYAGQGGNLLLVKRVSPNVVVYTKLTEAEHGDYYDVKTATPARVDAFKNKKPLWERAQSNQALSSPPLRGLTGQSGTADIIPPIESKLKKSLFLMRRKSAVQPDAWRKQS